MYFLHMSELAAAGCGAGYQQFPIFCSGRLENFEINLDGFYYVMEIHIEFIYGNK